jgi:hypothetical protein
MGTLVRVQEIEHEIGEGGRFALRVTSADVELRAVDGPRARVRATYELRADSDGEADDMFERVQLRATRGADELDLEEPRPDGGGLGGLARALRGRGGEVVDRRIEAEVPRRAEVRFNGVSAELTAIGLLGVQRYQTVSGDVVVSEAGGDIRLQSVSGDASVRADDLLVVEATTVSGDLSIVAPSLARVRINTVSGDAEVEGDLGHDGDHRVDTVSGDLSLGIGGGSLTLEVRGLSTEVHVGLPHRSEGSRDRRRYVIGDGRASLLFTSMSGDVSVHAAHRLDRRRHVAAGAPTSQVPAAVTPSAPSEGEEPVDEIEILRAVERGELSVEEAARRLEGR